MCAEGVFVPCLRFCLHAQVSANCRLEGMCKCPLERATRARSLGRPAERVLNHCGVASTDVHEQKKAWVPLMLEASFRPTGWLGIMCARSS